MDNFNMNNLIESLNKPYDQLDHAVLLSETWKTRATFLKNDLLKMIDRKIKYVKTLTYNGEYEKMSEVLIVIDEIRLIISRIESILERFKKEPCDIETIEQLISFEMFIYKIVVTDEVRNALIQEIKEDEEKTVIFNDLLNTIDQMWDNNETENAMKEKIYNVFRKLYPSYKQDNIVNLVLSFYTFATADKNVRVNLTDEQISSLKKEDFNKEENETCGTCLNDFCSGDKTIILSCEHRYHPECIIPWLKMSVKCPTCRVDLRE